MPHVLEVIDNHTVAVDLLTHRPILDAGSRGLRFASHFAKRGHRVIALDPGETEQAEGVESLPYALYANSSTELRLILTDDKEARYILERERHAGETYVPVKAVSLSELMDQTGIAYWDVVKLNIEGSEYGVLENWPGAIARQVVFSFHEHTSRARGKAECDRIIDRLAQWYDVHNRVWERRYGCVENYWDVLLTERGA